MRLPRDISGAELARLLTTLGYRTTRQTENYSTLTTEEGGEHRITVRTHGVLRVGTLAAVLAEVAQHSGLTRDELTEKLFGRPG